MSWFKKVFSSQQSNQSKDVYENSKSKSQNKEDNKEEEEETITVSELKNDESQKTVGVVAKTAGGVHGVG